MNVLFGALDWGLGHTTRILPLISVHSQNGDKVIIGYTKKQYPIYKEHFPELVFVKLSTATPKFSRRNSQITSAVSYLPRFIYSIISDKIRLAKIIRRYNIHKVYSDSRFGLYSKRTFNVFITHQLQIKLPLKLRFLKNLATNLNCKLINNFHECLIPDFNGNNKLSGELSNRPPRLNIPVKYVGPLSRFTPNKDEFTSNSPELLIIISGPEKQRTKFEKLILESLKNTSPKIDYLIIRGRPGVAHNNIPYSVNHCSSVDLKKYIQNAKYIICRSGYSTVMDLTVLNKTAMLIPTPGQCEQEYLADYLEHNKLFLSTQQDNIDINDIVLYLEKFIPKKLFFQRSENPAK